MTDDFAGRVRSHFPEGLTAVVVVGGTRTSFVLSRPAGATGSAGDEPGSIDPQEYARYGTREYLRLIRDYFELGGQNLVVPGFSYQTFTPEQTRTPGGWRGPQFRDQFTPLATWLAAGEFVEFYRALEIDPYFAGIDTLLSLPADDPAHALGAALRDFQAAWPYAAGRRRVVWEIASIPLYSYWLATAALPDGERAALAAELAAAEDLAALQRRLYRFYARAALGTDLPPPHLYLASNRNGDLKMRGPLSMSLAAGDGSMRCYYVPYPTLFTTRETLRTVIEDRMSGRGLRSHDVDYRGLLTPDLLRRERDRALGLAADPSTTLGLTRPH